MRARGETPGRSAVLGVTCFAGDLAGGARAVLERAQSGLGGYACLCNVHVLVSARHDDALRRALADAWLVLPDGAPIAWLQRRDGLAGARRIPGPDLMPLVFELGRSVGLRHFLFGSTDEVLGRLERHLRDRHPEARIVGSYSPPFPPAAEEEEARALETIRAARPDVVWCGLGAPKQEVWMRRHAAALAPAVVLGVGAAFDFLAATKQRAPVWMQDSGLEWLHRLASEPRRLAGRYFRTNSEFFFLSAQNASHFARAGLSRRFARERD